MIVYKIRRKSDGKFSNGGIKGRFSQHGKIWYELRYLKQHISGVENLSGTTISIFDRYGKQMTFLTSETEGWDGTYNGLNMPANDYWFVAKLLNGKEYRGHFALVR